MTDADGITEEARMATDESLAPSVESWPEVPDGFTMALRLCDDDGMVSDERADPQPAFGMNLTYLDMHNNARAYTRPTLPPIKDEFACTGSAHLGGEHIYCLSPAHNKCTVCGQTNGFHEENCSYVR